MEPIKIGIVGVGNIGKVLSVKLSSCGYNVEAVTGKSSHNIKIDNYYAYGINGDFGDLSYLVRVIDDEDELLEALNTGKITREEFDLANEACSRLFEEILANKNIFVNMDKKELIQRWFK